VAIETKLEKVVVSEEDKKFSKEVEEAERIRVELKAVIEKKKAFFQEEGAKLSATPEVLNRNIAYLDSVVDNTEKAFVAGDIEYLRGVLKIANEAVFKQEDPKKGKATYIEKMKEYSEEELFSVLVKYLKDGLPFTFSNPESGEKIIVESASAEMIKCRYNKEEREIKKITPNYVKDFLKFLEEKFHWKLRMPRTKKGSPLATEPVLAAAGTTPDIDESGFMGPFRSSKVPGDGNEPAVPVTKDKVTTKKNTLRGVAMRDATVHNIFDRNPFEGLSDSEEDSEEGSEDEPMTPEEERYEDLGILLKHTEYWSISGVVGDILGTVLIYSRKTGKSKGDIIDEMGGVDSVAEEILMPAIQKILPSEWSEDDKKFYSREFALECLELFIEEDEEIEK
jgi:hypothetical protein